MSGRNAPSQATLGALALLAGASCIALAPIMVKLSPLGPQATAFWRLMLALPALAVWAMLERRAEVRGSAAATQATALPWPLMMLAGFLFAGDLVTWHAGIVRTSAANATFLANLTPVVVTAATWAITRKAPGTGFLAALALAIAGGALLSGGAPGQNPEALLGDALSALTSVWYAAYIIVIARIRRSTGPGFAMLASTAVAAPLTLLAALLAGEVVVPEASFAGLWPLIVLGLVSHALGQGLLAYGLGITPPAPASVLILIQPVLAALLGWVILSEGLGTLQIAGGALVLAAIWLARRSA